MAIEVLIAGLDTVRERALTVAVRQTIREMRARDVLRIAVLPSDADNRWDVGVRRRGGWSVTRFDSTVEDLATRVTHALRSA